MQKAVNNTNTPKKPPLQKGSARPKKMPAFDPKSFLRNFIEFSEKINEELLCAICCNLLYQPTYLPCNHKFCFPCVERWYNHENIAFQCPMCQTTYPWTINLEIDKNQEQRILQQYEKEYKLLSQYKNWEYNNRPFNEVKCFYGNTYSENGGTRKWGFFFRLKQGVSNNYVEKITLKINANSQGQGGQNAELTKYPFIYNHTINGVQTIFSLIVFIHWKKNLGESPTKINYEVLLAPEGKLLSYLFKQKLKGKRIDTKKRNKSQ